MIRTHFETLWHKREQLEGRKLSIRQIAKEAGVSPNTIQRMRKSEIDRVYISTLDKFCRYFRLQHVGELIEYLPNDTAT